MVNFCAVCGCCTRTDIVREHLEDTLRICDVSAKGLYLLFLSCYCDILNLLLNILNVEDQTLFCATNHFLSKALLHPFSKLRDLPEK